ncbi:MAG TPA: hypothetical protein VH916_02880 [Dehalococcoidia bacterium]|jgi:hypothetical protein
MGNPGILMNCGAYGFFMLGGAPSLLSSTLALPGQIVLPNPGFVAGGGTLFQVA